MHNLGKKIGVFCGSSLGFDPVFQEQAKCLAEVILKKGLSLVYGGSNAGLMGVIAGAVMKGGGTVTGVIPKSIADQVEPLSVTELHVVSTMHERKKKMYDLSDAFLAFPGGLGTLDEIFEALTWTQLGIHSKACGFLNINGYYDKLLAFLDQAVAEGFIKQEHRDMIQSDPDPEKLMEKILSSKPILTAKWQ